MTLLSAVNEVLGEIGLDPLTSVASSTDQRALSMMAVAKAAQAKLGRYNWPVLQAEHTFTTVDGTAAYDLPTDFKRLLSETAYNSSDTARLMGSATPAEWQWQIQNGSLNSVERFRISGYASKFRITPTPSSADDMSFWYVSSNFAVSSGGTGKALAVLDTDVSKFDEDLLKREIKWRYLRQRGYDYMEDFREAAEVLERELAAAFALPEICIGKNETDLALTSGYIPETGYGA